MIDNDIQTKVQGSRNSALRKLDGNFIVETCSGLAVTDKDWFLQGEILIYSTFLLVKMIYFDAESVSCKIVTTLL